MYSETFNIPGSDMSGIGVVNVTNNIYTSGLSLDNFKLSGGSIANRSFETATFCELGDDWQRWRYHGLLRKRRAGRELAGIALDGRSRAVVAVPAVSGRCRRGAIVTFRRRKARALARRGT